jgi:hypothetical protein
MFQAANPVDKAWRQKMLSLHLLHGPKTKLGKAAKKAKSLPSNGS